MHASRRPPSPAGLFARSKADGLTGAVCALFVGLWPGALHAENGGLHGTLTLASEYRYDGVGASSGRPVAQANFAWSNSRDFYVGLFASRVDYSDYGDQDTSLELDVYVGKTWRLGHAARASTLTAELAYFGYPDQSSGPTYGFLQLTMRFQHSAGNEVRRAEIALSPAGSYGSGPTIRGEVGYTRKLAAWLSVGSEAGLRVTRNGAQRIYGDLGASASVGRLLLDLRYYRTNLTVHKCGAAGPCAGALVGKVSVTI